MKKLLSILGVFAFVATPAMSVIACGNQEVAPTKIGDLEDGTNLGVFKAEPTAEQVKKVLELRVENLDLAQVDIAKPENGSVKISGKTDSKDYKDLSINLKYGVGNRADITTLFTKNDLGKFTTATAPTEKELHDALVAKITTLASGITAEQAKEIQVDVTGGTPFGVKADEAAKNTYRVDFSVKDDSTSFNRSWVHMTYTVEAPVTPPGDGEGDKTSETFADATPKKLSEVLTKVTLDASKIDHHLAASEILALVQEANKENKDFTEAMYGELQVINNQASGTATIGVVPNATNLDSKSSSVNVTYTAPVNITTGGKGIWNRNLGELNLDRKAETEAAKNANIKLIMDQIKKLNSGVISDDIELTFDNITMPAADDAIFGSAKITTKEAAKTLKKGFTVTVNFTVPKVEAAAK